MVNQQHKYCSLVETVFLTPQLQQVRPQLRHFSGFIFGGRMSNRIQACDLHALYLRLEALRALTQQLEELQQLRDRIQGAEAKARRYQGRRQEKHASFLRMRMH